MSGEDALPTVHLRILVTAEGKRVLQQRFISLTGERHGTRYQRHVDEWRDVAVVSEADVSGRSQPDEPWPA